MHAIATPSRLVVLLVTDIVGSTELKSRIGLAAYARLLARHDELFKQLIAAHPASEILKDTGDGSFRTRRSRRPCETRSGCGSGSCTT